MRSSSRDSPRWLAAVVRSKERNQNWSTPASPAHDRAARSCRIWTGCGSAGYASWQCSREALNSFDAVGDVVNQTPARSLSWSASRSSSTTLPAHCANARCVCLSSTQHVEGHHRPCRRAACAWRSEGALLLLDVYEVALTVKTSASVLKKPGHLRAHGRPQQSRVHSAQSARSLSAESQVLGRQLSNSSRPDAARGMPALDFAGARPGRARRHCGLARPGAYSS